MELYTYKYIYHLYNIQAPPHLAAIEYTTIVNAIPTYISIGIIVQKFMKVSDENIS